jgi:hydroxymethylpyrimidine pyrophosphatase-like HAD family hydrolase
VTAPAYRLLALDIDGTLLRTDKTVSERTRAALLAARELGVNLVLVTGRRYPAARRVAAGLGGPMDLVLHNGALIVRLGGEQGETLRTDDGAPILRCRPLSRELARRSIRIGRQRGADPVVHAGQRGEGLLLVQDVAASNPLLTYYLDRSAADVVRVADLEAALDGLDPLQVMFGGALEEMETLLPLLASRLGVDARIERTVYPASGVGILDVLASGVGKAEALGFLQERGGFHASETLAVGDNWNDQQMLEQAGLGLVMGNANPQMLALGLPVLPTNEEDGVAVAVERYILCEERKRG